MIRLTYKSEALGNSEPTGWVRVGFADLLAIGCASGLTIAIAVYQWCVG